MRERGLLFLTKLVAVVVLQNALLKIGHLW
jgi:hypothetical protein